MNYRIIRRQNPLKRGSEAKWYAIPKREKSLKREELSKLITANSSTTPSEVESSLQLMSESLPVLLRKGFIVKLPYMGSIYVSFRSKGTENIGEFNSSKAIYSPRLVFKFNDNFRKQVLNGLSFSDGGVLEDGVEYGSIASYCLLKGLTPNLSPDGDDDNSGSNTGDNGGGSNSGSGSGSGSGGDDDDDMA